MEHLKNLPISPEKLSDMISVKPNMVASMSFSKNENIDMTLLAFAEGEGISEEAYKGDTCYLVLEGEMTIISGENRHVLGKGDCMAVQAEELHAIEGRGSFKILQITLY